MAGEGGADKTLMGYCKYHLEFIICIIRNLYLCNVSKKIRNKLFFIATIIVLLLSIDFVSTYLTSDYCIELCSDCPDFTRHSGHSHNHTFGDEVFCCESHLNQNNPEGSKDFSLSHKILFTDSYFSKIWQPPKIS